MADVGLLVFLGFGRSPPGTFGEVSYGVVLLGSSRESKPVIFPVSFFSVRYHGCCV